MANLNKNKDAAAEQPVFFDKITVLTLSLFFALSFLLMLYHEPWRDEAQAWLLARDAPNYEAMISTLRYENTGALWHTLLFPLAQLNFPYRSMQALTLVIILSGAILFFRFSPFAKSTKVLFLFGYFMLYEYNIIARHYALAVPLLFLIATFYWQKMRTWAYPLLLFLLANTSVFGFIISAVLFGDYCWEYWSRRQESKDGNDTKTNHTKKIIRIIILSFILLIPLIQLIPPADADRGFHKIDLSMQRIGGTASSVISAFLPLPKIQPTFWSTRLLYFTSPLLIFLVVPLFVISLVLLWPYKKPFFVYLFSSLGFFAIFFFVSIGLVRQHGSLFLMFVFCSWIALAGRQKLLVKSSRALGSFLAIIFLVHVVAAGIAAYYEFNYNFSNGKDTAFFLKENNLINDDTVIAIHRSALATSLSPYLPKGYKFYCLEQGKYCSHLFATNEVSSLDTMKKNLPYFEKMSSKNHILVLTHPDYIQSIPNRQKYTLIASFEGAISHEDYYIYKLI